MQNLIALTKRELKSFFYSPIAYVVGALFLLLQGWTFYLLFLVLNDARVDPTLTMSQTFFGGSFFYWFSIMLICPLMTMRTFSEEKRTGTIEFLHTAPVTDNQVVLAKFLGAWLAYVFFWLLTGSFFLLLWRFSPFDPAPVLTGYLGTFLLGAVLTALGVLASSLTRNQVIAAVFSFVAILLFFSIGIMDLFVRDPEMSKVIQYLSLMEHLRDFSKGFVDTRPVVFYLSVTGVFLFITGRIVSHPRWRS